MFDKNALTKIIAAYKQDFQRIHNDEIYKRKAVKCFHDNWDISADDFVAMMNRAFSQTDKLLALANFFPRRMICLFAEKDPEAVRSMYVELFDESLPVVERIENFIAHAEELRMRYSGGAWRSHYQTVNSVSIYLFLRDPGKYYIFKFEKFKKFAPKIGYSDMPKMGRVSSVLSYYNMCDEVLKVVKLDVELCDMSSSRLTENDYFDDDFHILTEDIVYFGSMIEKRKDEETFYEYDDPIDITQEQWREMLNNPNIMI